MKTLPSLGDVLATTGINDIAYSLFQESCHSIFLWIEDWIVNLLIVLVTLVPQSSDSVFLSHDLRNSEHIWNAECQTRLECNGRRAIRVWPDNQLIQHTFNQNCSLVSSPGQEMSPFVHGAPNPFLLVPPSVLCARWRHKKMRDRIRTRPEGVLLGPRVCHESSYSHRHTLFSEQVFASFFVIYGLQSGFPGVLVWAESENLRAVAQKLRRLLFHMFCYSFAGGFSAHAFLKSTFTDFDGGGLVQTVLFIMNRWRERLYKTCKWMSV